MTLTFGAGYASLAELGLQQASVRVLAAARSRGDHRMVDEVVSTTLAVFVVLGVLLALAFAVLAAPLVRVFNIPHSLQSDAFAVFLIIGVQAAFDLPTASFIAVVEGAQRFSLARAVEIPMRIGWGITVVIAVTAGASVRALAWSSLAFAMLGLIAAVIAACNVQRGLRVRLANVNVGSLRMMTRESSGMLGIRVLSVVYNQMDRFILGVLLSVAAVSEYDIVFKIHALGFMVVGIASSAVMPAASSLSASGEHHRLPAFFIRGSRFALALSLPVIIAAIVFADWLIGSWVGNRYKYLATDARIFLLYPLIAVIVSVGEAMLVGIGRVGIVVRFTALSVATNLVLSVLLAPSMGIRGVVLGSVIGAAVSAMPLLWTCLRAFDTPFRNWLGKVIVPNVPGSLVVLGVGCSIRTLIGERPTFLVVCAATLASIAAGIVVFLAGGASSEDRADLRRAIRWGQRNESSAG